VAEHFESVDDYISSFHPTYRPCSKRCVTRSTPLLRRAKESISYQRLMPGCRERVLATGLVLEQAARVSIPRSVGCCGLPGAASGYLDRTGLAIQIADLVGALLELQRILASLRQLIGA